MWKKRKFLLACGFAIVGSVIAFVTHATLAEYTMFCTAVFGSFAASDVTDKKLNGGTYHE